MDGEAIYGTLGGPYKPELDFSTTRKGNNIYIHILKADTNMLTLPPIPERKIRKAYVLKGPAIDILEEEKRITIPVPKKAQPYVVVLELNKPAETIPAID